MRYGRQTVYADVQRADEIVQVLRHVLGVF